MQARIAIGDFARMTHLSVKALRHYHDVGLLEPAQVDPWSGYRFYEPGQVPLAQVIRRFRDLGMPLEEVRAVLEAPDVGARNDVIVAHLERMESQLAQTQAVVASLRSLLDLADDDALARWESLDLGYTQTYGLPALRAAIASTYRRRAETGHLKWSASTRTTATPRHRLPSTLPR